MVSTMLEIPTFPEDTIRAITNDVFKVHLRHNLREIIRNSIGGESVNAPAGSIGAAVPELAELAERMKKEQLPVSVDEMVEKAIAEYSTLWNQARHGKLKDSSGRAPWIHSVPHENDSLVNLVLSGIEFSDAPQLKTMPLTKVYSHQLLYGQRLRALAGISEQLGVERGGTPVQGKAYVVPSSPWAGYSVALFVPDEMGKVLRVKISSPEKGMVSSEYEPFSEAAAEAFYNLTSSRPLVSDVVLLYAALMAADDGAGKMLNLKVIFDNVVLHRLTGKVAEKDQDKYFNNIIAAIRAYPSHFFVAEESSLGGIEGRLKSLRTSINKKYSGGSDLLPVEAQAFVTNAHYLTKEGLPVDAGVMSYAVPELIKIHEKLSRFLYERLSASIEFLKLKGSSDASVLSEDELRKVDADNRLFSLYCSIGLPWQARYVLGDQTFFDAVEEAKRCNLLDSPTYLDAARDGTSLSFTGLVPLSKLPETAREYTEFIYSPSDPLKKRAGLIGREFDIAKAAKEPLLHLGSLYALGFRRLYANALERYNSQQKPVSS